MSEKITVDKLQVLLEAYTKPYQEELKKVKQQTAQAVKHIDAQTNKIRNSFSKVKGVIAGALGVAAITSFAKSCINLGSDLQEVQNVVDVTFGNMNSKVDAFAKNAIEQFGLSELATKKYMGTYGAMAKSFGFDSSSVYEMSEAITGLTADVASFYNLSTDEAYTKMKSIFTGETESLKEIGVVMTQTALDQYALNNGFGKTTAKMTEQEKVMLRYQFVMSSLSGASGDFARTSDGWANSTRVLTLRFEQLKATIGQGLINVFTPVIKVINTVIAKLQVAAEFFRQLTTALFGNAGGSNSNAMSGMESSLGNADNSSSNIAGNLDNATASAKELKNQLMGFDEINKLSEDSSGSGTGTGTGVDTGIPSLDNVNGILNSLDEEMTSISGKAAKYAKIIKDAFDELKQICQPTTDAVKKLWNEGLAKLGYFSGKQLNDFFNSFLKPVGAWTLGEGIPRFIDALNNGIMAINYENINKSLKNLWNALTPFSINLGEGLLWCWENVLVPLGTWTTNEVVPRFLDTLASTIEIANSVIEAMKPNFEWFWNSVLSPISNWAADIFLSTWDGINGLLSIFSDWCANNQEIIGGTAIVVGGFFAAWKITEMLAFVQQAGGVMAAIKLITDAIKGARVAKLLDKIETMALTAMYAKDFVVNLAKGTIELTKQAAQFALNTGAKVADAVAQGALTIATTAWNVVCGIATAATSALGAAFTFLTSPIGLVIIAIAGVIAIGVLLYKNWDVLKEKATQVWSWITDIFEKFDNFLQNIFAADFTKSFGTLGNILNAYKQNVENIWNSIKQIFSGITDFVSGVFTGNWEKAWNGVKDIFGGIFNGMIALVKAPFNVIIGVINGLISAIASGVNFVTRSINKLSFKVPDWIPGLGGKSFGFNIPSISPYRIPMLAQGGYVKANDPRLAIIGDNTQYGEIVAPENKMLEMAKEAARQVSNMIFTMPSVDAGKLKSTLIPLFTNNAVSNTPNYTQLGEIISSKIIAALKENKTEVVLKIEGDPKKIFKVVKEENNKTVISTGKPQFLV